MERLPAAAQGTHDPVQASLASWDLERRVRDQAEPAQPGDERDEEIFVLRVVGDVDEHGVEGKAWTRSGSTGARWHRPPRRAAAAAPANGASWAAGAGGPAPSPPPSPERFPAPSGPEP